MAMTGKLKSRNGKLYVLYVYNEFAEPFRQYIWWRVLEVHRNAYNMSSPEPEDEVTYRGNGYWSAGSRGGVVTGDGNNQAETIERVSVLAPPSRGKELRWNDGQWERLTAKGWVAAGEGDARPAARRSTKTKQQLNREIEQATGIRVRG
jgi:hypothetical protein